MSIHVIPALGEVGSVAEKNGTSVLPCISHIVPLHIKEEDNPGPIVLISVADSFSIIKLYVLEAFVMRNNKPSEKAIKGRVIVLSAAPGSKNCDWASDTSSILFADKDSVLVLSIRLPCLNFAMPYIPPSEDRLLIDANRDQYRSTLYIVLKIYD